MLPLPELFQPIAHHLERASEVFRAELQSADAFVGELFEHVEHYHGKQLRPALLFLTAEACGGVQPAHHTLAAVVEMVHIATLVHDDVLDEGEMRRRAATVNHLWGNERAVLLGDLLFSHAYRLCSTLDDQFAAQAIGATAVAVCEGELLQINHREDFNLTEAAYYRIIAGKTASLIATCALLGARYADADAETVEQLRRFGEALGRAFQIRDDLLDLLGNEDEAGKSLGRDVEKGKLTLALIHYLREASPADRKALLTMLRGGSPNRDQEVAEVLRRSASIDYARQAAVAQIETARAILDQLPPTPARDTLSAMSEFVLARKY